MENNNILDDLDIYDDQGEDPKRNAKLVRGLLVGIPMQFMFWGILFSFRRSLTENKIEILAIEAMNYSLNLNRTGYFFLMMLLGSISYLLLSAVKSQSYKKILLANLFFATCSCISVGVWIGYKSNAPWYLFLVEYFLVSLKIIGFQFVLLGGLALLLKQKNIIIGVFLVFLTFFLIGFLN